MVDAQGPNPTPAKARPGTTAEPRRPYHVGVAMGLCVGVYAASLGVVTVLQIDHDRAVIIDRAPVGEAIDMLNSHNDRMATEIEIAGRAFQRTADGYDEVTIGVTDLDEAVRRLTARVTAIKGSAMKIPDRLVLPTVPRTSSRGGGSGSVSGGGSSGSVSQPKPKPAPPPTHGSTGASGGG